MTFSVAAEQLGKETLMSFVLQPGAYELLDVSMLELEATANGWQATNDGAPANK